MINVNLDVIETNGRRYVSLDDVNTYIAGLRDGLFQLVLKGANVVQANMVTDMFAEFAQAVEATELTDDDGT